MVADVNFVMGCSTLDTKCFERSSTLKQRVSVAFCTWVRIGLP